MKLPALFQIACLQFITFFLTNVASAHGITFLGTYASPSQYCAMKVKLDPRPHSQDLLVQFEDNPLYTNVFCNTRDVVSYKYDFKNDLYKYDNGDDTYCILKTSSTEVISFDLFCYWKVDDSFRNMDTYKYYSY